MNHEQSGDLPSASTTADLTSARRRAFLAKVGKGSAAMAALAPLPGLANGTHKLPNPALPGGFGVCTLSGFQSAAVSGAPATVCSAPAPSDYLTCQDLDYGAECKGKVDAKELAKALNKRFFDSKPTITEKNVNSTLLASSAKHLVVTGKNLVVCAKSTSQGVSLQRKGFPDLDPTRTFKSVFTNSTDGRTLLEVLYDGVLDSSPATAKCYFLSAYLTVYNGTSSNLPQGFDRAYVIAQYTDGDAKFGTNAYLFFKTLCGR